MIIDLDSCYLDHIAIATDSLDKAQKVYEDLGLQFSPKREVVTDQKVTTAFAQIDKRAHIELLEPLNGEGPIQKFLEKKGPGIHHLCFRVPDIKSSCKELLQKGYQFIQAEPFIGANNCLVNFIHPKSSGGVLIELSQKMED